MSRILIKKILLFKKLKKKSYKFVTKGLALPAEPSDGGPENLQKELTEEDLALVEVDQ